MNKICIVRYSRRCIALAVVSLTVLPVSSLANEPGPLLDWGGDFTDCAIRERASHLSRAAQLNTADRQPEEVRGWKFDLGTPLTWNLPSYHGVPVYAGLGNASLGRGNVSAVQSYGFTDDGANDAMFFTAIGGKTNVLLLVWKKDDFAGIRTERIGFSKAAHVTITDLAVETGVSEAAHVTVRWWVLNGGEYFVARKAVTLPRDGRLKISDDSLACLEWGRHALAHQTYKGLFVDHDVAADRRSAEMNDIQAVGLLIQADRPKKNVDITIRRFTVMAAPGNEPPGWAERLYEAGLPSGLVVHAGVGNDLAVQTQLARDGRYLVHGLHPDLKTVHALRLALAEKGLFPAANVEWMIEPGRLPYKNGLLRAVIVDSDHLGSAAPSDKEIRRALAYGGIAWIIKGDHQRVLRKEFPDDIDDWTHAFHGPDRIPISNDRRVRPVTGLRWQAGTDKNNPRIGLRIAGGRTFQIIRVDSSAKLYSYRQTDVPMWLVARDAANGVILWRRALGIDEMPNTPHDYYASSHHFVATRDTVCVYTDVGAPLTALDATTGRVKRVYDQGARLSADARQHKGFLQRFATMFVLVRDGRIIQTMGSKLWCLDEHTGEVLYQRDDLQGSLTYVAWVGDRVFAIETGPTPVAVALDSETGETLWRTPIQRAKYYQMFADNKTIVVGHNGGGHPIQATWFVTAIDTTTGKVRWCRETGNQYRGYVFAADGRIWFQDAYRGHDIMDVDTGELIARKRYGAIGGGCGIEVMTPEYIVRGTHLVPRDDQDHVYTLSAVRPNCEVPMYPSYGSIFTTGTGCGCDWYLEGSAFALHDARPVSPLDDGLRLHTPESAPVLDKKVRCLVRGDVPHDWTWVSDPGSVSKANRWQRFDRSGENDDLKDAFGKNIEKVKWYSVERTSPVRAGDLELVCRVPDQMLEARKDDKVVWTFLAGARITVAPQVRGGLVFIGCNDGWVYAVRVTDGSVAWQRLVAPEHKMMVAFGAVESTWPVFGVLLHEGRLYYQAGRSTAVDEGLWAGALDPETGEAEWTGRSAVFPAKLGAKEMNDHGYRTFKNRSLGLNSPLKFHKGRIRYLHSHHAWDPKNPQDLLNDHEHWIGNRRR